jgi:hypothetical protein
MLFVAAYAAYCAARWAFAGNRTVAIDNARWVLELERSVGVAIETSVHAALGSGVAAWLLSNVYMAAQLVVLPGALVWVYRRSLPVYRVLRTTVLASWLLALPIYAIFPVAPPRLAGLGLIDTVSQQVIVGLTGRSTIFYNEFAAVPSLHVGFAFALGIAVAIAARSAIGRAAALLWGPVVSLAVVATANHFVLDIAAGLLVTAAGFGLATTIAHRRPRPRAWRPPRPADGVRRGGSRPLVPS